MTPAGIRLAELGSQLTGAPALLSRQRLVDLREEHWTCSADLARRTVGWRARTSLEEGLARTAAWYRENRWLPGPVPGSASARSR